MDDKLDSIASAIFRRLDTPSERDVLTYIDAHNGPKNCVARDELLVPLLWKTGEATPGLGNLNTLPETLTELRDSLLMELNEDLKETLSENQTRFEKLLNVQNNNLERISDQMEGHGLRMLDHGVKLDNLVTTSLLILEEGKVIRKALVPNTEVKLKDPVCEVLPLVLSLG